MAKRLQLLSPLKGESAYELARKNGFEGTEAEWITSLQGVDGKSAYEYAKESGYTGTEEEFYQKLTEDCIPTPSTATVGQTIAVKTVDDSGKPTEWEAVDITPTDPDALASLSGQVAALQTSIRPYEWAVTSTSMETYGWSTFLDLPTERFYRFNNSVPESFGLPVTGKNGTLVAFDASNASTNWFVMYICAALISSTEEKYYVTYANKTASLSNVVWKELVTDREQLLQDAMDSASGQFIEGLSGLVLGVDRPKIVLLGDSVMAGVGTSDYSATGDLVINKTFTNGRTFEIYRDVGAKSWAAQFKAHMESTYPGCSVTNNGVPGFTTWQLSDSMDVLVPEDADIAIVQIGTNSRNADDKTTLIIDSMKVIIDHLRDNGITPIIMTNTVLLNQTAPNDAQNVRQCIMAACAEKGVYCYDVLGEMEWYLANHGMAASDIMTDDLHPNDDGHALIFEIYKKLLRVGDGGVINIVENPSTSSSGLYVGTEEPTDSNATVWIDTDDSEAIDCIPTPSTATVGQTIVVKAVDENGKPTAWEAVDKTDEVNHGRILAEVNFTEDSTGVTVTDINADVTELTVAFRATTDVFAPDFSINNHTFKMYTGGWKGKARIYVKIDKKNGIVRMKYRAANGGTACAEFSWGKDEIVNSVGVSYLGFTSSDCFIVYEGLLALLTKQSGRMANIWLEG